MRTALRELLKNVSALGGIPSPTKTLELRFGAGLQEQDLVALLDAVSSANRRHWVAFDAEATAPGVRHLVHAPADFLELFTSRMRAHAPSVRLETSGEEGFVPTVCARVSSSRRHLLLRADVAVQTSSAVLAALTEPLGKNERLLLRTTVRPASPRALHSDGNQPFFTRNRVDKRQRSQIETKYDGPLVATETRVHAYAETPQRARQLANRVLEALRHAQGASGRLHAHRDALRATIPATPRIGLFKALVMTPTEAASVIGWPLGNPDLAGLELGAAPRLAAPTAIPDGGRPFGISNARESSGRQISQPIDGALNHTVITGPTGAGKSTLLLHLIKSDIDAGRGAFVLDGKGDLVDAVLEQIPHHRRRDVIVLDPSSDLPQPGLRLFPPGVDIELSADLMLATLSELFKDSFGVRSRQYFRLGLVTLGNHAGATLLDLPRLFHDRAFRGRVLAGATDTNLIAAWQRFDALSAGEQVQHLSSPMNKVDELVSRRSLRSVLGQRYPKLHFGEVLARSRIVLIRLSPGQLGAPAARLLAGLTTWLLFTAVEARSAIAPADRRPFMAYIDELAALAALPLPLEGVLERARGLGVGLTLSPQSLSQLSRPVQAAALANAGSFVAFRQASEQEAKLAAGALPRVTAHELTMLERFEIALRLSFGPGHVTRTMTAATHPPLTRRVSDPQEVRELSARNWSQPIDDVSEETLAPTAVELPESNRRRRSE